MPTTRIVPFVKAETNRERLLAYLRTHGTVTPMRAMVEWGDTRLAARVQELREEGYCIETTMQTAQNGKRYAEYQLDCDRCRIATADCIAA